MQLNCEHDLELHRLHFVHAEHDLEPALVTEFAVFVAAVRAS
jgi:hypothetical protein